jgi:hypothetical protein
MNIFHRISILGMFITLIYSQPLMAESASSKHKPHKDKCKSVITISQHDINQASHNSTDGSP